MITYGGQKVLAKSYLNILLKFGVWKGGLAVFASLKVLIHFSLCCNKEVGGGGGHALRSPTLLDTSSGKALKD